MGVIGICATLIYLFVSLGPRREGCGLDWTPVLRWSGAARWFDLRAA